MATFLFFGVNLMKRVLKHAIFSLALSALVLTSSSSAFCDEPVITAKGDTPVETALTQLIGKSVTLRLENGADVSGKVAEVGNEAVLIKELSPGQEFYNAVVSLENITAVVYRR